MLPYQDSVILTHNKSWLSQFSELLGLNIDVSHYTPGGQQAQVALVAPRYLQRRHVQGDWPSTNDHECCIQKTILLSVRGERLVDTEGDTCNIRALKC